MTEERLGGADRDVRASNTRHAFQILQAPVVRGRPQLRRVTAMSAQLHVKEIGDIDIQVRMKRLLPPGELRLLVRGDEIDKALFTAEVRAAGSEGGAERRLVVLVVRGRGEQQHGLHWKERRQQLWGRRLQLGRKSHPQLHFLQQLSYGR